MHRAAALGHLESVQVLVQHGADVEIKNQVCSSAPTVKALSSHILQNGWTALHVACYYHHLPIVNLLVEVWLLFHS